MTEFAKRGFTLVEIMIVVAIIALLAAIAIPNVLRGRTTANETAAIGNLRALVGALEMYRSVYNEYPINWTVDLYDNATPSFGPGMFDKDTQSPDAVKVQGFFYNYSRTSGQTYFLNAHPEIIDRTGTRSFWADDSAQIQHCSGDKADDTAVNGAAVPIDQLTVKCI